MDADVEALGRVRNQCAATVGAAGPRCQLSAGHTYGHQALGRTADGSTIKYTWSNPEHGGRLYQSDAYLSQRGG